MPLENVVCIDPKNTNLQKNRGGGIPPPGLLRLKNTLARKGLNILYRAFSLKFRHEVGLKIKNVPGKRCLY